MREAEGKYQFSKSEIAALQNLKDRMASGEVSENIAGYQPDIENLPILSGVRIFLQEPRWFGEPAEEPYDPKEKIADLVRRLDEKIMSNPKKKVSNIFEGCEVTVQAEDGAYLTIGRNRLETVGIKVERPFYTFGNQPEVYPYLSSEEFHLSEDGIFTRDYWERYSPYKGCRRIQVVHFNHFSPEFSDEDAKSLRYFSDLVAPFLSAGAL